MKERLRHQTEGLRLGKKRTLVNVALAGALVLGAHGCREQEQQHDLIPDTIPTHHEQVLFDDNHAEVEQQEHKLFHNGKIGIEMSEFLPGIIDLKYYKNSSLTPLCHDKVISDGTIDI